MSNESSKYEPYAVTESSETKCPDLIFDLRLSESEWLSIYPQKKVYKEKGTGGKTYSVLKFGWTDLIAKMIFLKTKVPCAYAFKFAKVFVSENAEVYLQILGTCKECGAQLKAHCLHPPVPGDGITIRVHTLDTSGIPHYQKRYIRGETRDAIGRELQYKKPRLYRNETVEDLSFGDPEPPYLPKNSTLRKIRQNARDKELGIGSKLNLRDSLEELKNQVGYIKDLGDNAFHCFYWSSMQMDMYKKLIKITRRIEIDATGSLVKSINRLNKEKKVIYLYQIVLKGMDGIQPVFQMLSEKHDANFICYFLREILRAGAPVLPEVDCDFSLALLNAVCLAYNERSLKNYLLDCFRFLLDTTLQHPLQCFIRVDIAHLIRLFCRKKVFENKHPKVKDIFVRCVALMSTCENLSDFAELLESALIVALSEYDGKDETGKDVICAEKRSFIIERIKTFELEDESTNNRDYDHLDDDVEKNDSLTDFIEKMFDDAKLKVSLIPETQDLNAFYCPAIAKHLIRLAKYFPIWTNVMLKYFPQASKIASSARCEAYFKDLKHNDLGLDFQPLRADKFIVKHMKSIDSISKIQYAALKQVRQTAAIEKVISKAKRSNSYLSEQENWRGKNMNTRNSETIESIDTESEFSQDDIVNISNSETTDAEKSKQVKITYDDSDGEADAGQKTDDFEDTYTLSEKCSAFSNVYSESDKFISGKDNCYVDINDASKLSVKKSSVDISDASISMLKKKEDSHDENIKTTKFKILNSLEISSEFDGTIDDFLGMNKENEHDFSGRDSEGIRVGDVLKLLEKENNADDSEIFTTRANNDNSEAMSPLTENQVNKTRGKYLTPRSTIEYEYNRPIRRRQDEVLVNGNKCGAVSMYCGKVYLHNTCPFDSIIEVLTRSYCDYAAFKVAVDSQNSLFFEFIPSFVKNGVSRLIYRERAEFLSLIYKVESNYVDCTDSVYNLLDGVLSDTPSVTIRKNCRLCGTMTKSHNIVEMSKWVESKSFAENLISFANEVFTSKKTSCDNCDRSNKISDKCTYEVLKTGMLVVFDVQLLSELGLSKTHSKGIQLQDIPLQLTLNTQKYILSGLIQFTPNPNHFVGYSRSVSGIWNVHNDLMKKVQKTDSKKAGNLQVPLLFYVKVT